MACVAFVRVSYRQLTASCGFKYMGAKRVQNKFSLEDREVMLCSLGRREMTLGRYRNLAIFSYLGRLQSHFLKCWYLTVIVPYN